MPAASAASILRATAIGLASFSYPHSGTSGCLCPSFLETASYTFCHSPQPCGKMPSSFQRGSGWYAGQTIAATSYSSQSAPFEADFAEFSNPAQPEKIGVAASVHNRVFAEIFILFIFVFAFFCLSVRTENARGGVEILVAVFFIRFKIFAFRPFVPGVYKTNFGNSPDMFRLPNVWRFARLFRILREISPRISETFFQPANADCCPAGGNDGKIRRTAA